MDTGHKMVRLSAEELAYLNSENVLPEALVTILKGVESINDKHAIRVSSDIAEQFRSAFTDRLGEVGFDADYELTDEGKMLEDLIDRFYVPSAP